ncbi:WD repeat-containing protein 5 homolog [Aspergillus udagawae]|uniref:Fucose-specific lectin n=1 Tax=Aspergillus udagawae TaxID=91492 RepID=A0A8H3SHU1_9EURO|nr:WD repeat-containing protein 5 homolog [Aspergillus udagawae]
MATAASLDSVEFFLGGNRNLRVYYQFGDDNTLRESCFAQDYGWFIRGNGIIAKDAKRNSPVTATRWTDNPGTTQIRVYYVDDAHDIRECQGDSQLTSLWTSRTIGYASDTEIGLGSQLAIARPDKDDQLLRLFY